MLRAQSEQSNGQMVQWLQKFLFFIMKLFFVINAMRLLQLKAQQCTVEPV